MSKTIKLVPVDLDTFDLFQFGKPQQAPIDILAPSSYELTTEMTTNTGVGVLGNTLVGQRFFLEREYNFSWVGDKREIDKIRFYLTQTSKEFFIFGGLTENKTITPSVMYNSKSMLASLVDQYKPVSSRYQDYLPNYRFDEAPRRGSTGVRMGNGNPNDLENQYGILPGYARGARTYVLLEKGQNYSWMIDQNYSQSTDENPHTVPFNVTVVALSSTNGGVVDQKRVDFTDISGYLPLYNTTDSDVLVRIDLIPPYDVATNKDNTNLAGILNYSAPIIGVTDDFSEWGKIERSMAESFEEQPSLLTPVNSGVYNMRNKRIAEFSISFREIVYELPR